MFKSGIIILLTYILGTTSLFCQNIQGNIGARAGALGGAGTASLDFWSIANNQASLGFHKDWQSGFFYENRFLTKALSVNAISLVMPTKKGAFAANVSYMGYSMYNEKKLGLAYGMPLTQNLALGVQLDYLHTYIGNNYGNKGNFTFELGMLAKISEKLNLGVHLFNPIRVKLSEYNEEKIPAFMKLGLQWELDNHFIALAEVQSDIDRKIIIIGGLEYQIREVMYARIGFNNNPNNFSFGMGLILRSVRLDFSACMHQVLGISPQISLIYIFKSLK